MDDIVEVTDAADHSNVRGVIRPTMTIQGVKFISWEETTTKEASSQLLIHTEAVDKDTPLLLMDKGNTSLGSTHAIGPNDTP